MAFKKNKKQGLFSKKVRKNEDAEFFYSADKNEEDAGEISAENMDEILNIASTDKESYEEDLSDDEDNAYFPDNDMEDDEEDEFYEGSDEEDDDYDDNIEGDEEKEEIDNSDYEKEEKSAGIQLYTNDDGRMYFINPEGQKVYVTAIKSSDASADENEKSIEDTHPEVDLYEEDEKEETEEVGSEVQDEESESEETARIDSEYESASEEEKVIESESIYDNLNLSDEYEQEEEYISLESEDAVDKSEKDEESEMDKVIESSALEVIGMKNAQIAVGNTTGKIEKMLAKHGEDYTSELSKAFETLIKSDPSAAATIYMAATVATLNTFEGDADKMAEALDIDDRDITMAEYEFHARYNKQQ